ncbi:MAG: hypothetical protein R3E55_00040 [Burkholderiaceae bacterium]
MQIAIHTAWSTWKNWAPCQARRCRCTGNGWHATAAHWSRAFAERPWLPPCRPTWRRWALQVLVEGLLQSWLLDPQAYDLVQAARASIGTYLRGLGLEAWPDQRGVITAPVRPQRASGQSGRARRPAARCCVALFMGMSFCSTTCW